MKKFIARTEELAILKRVDQSTQSEFVAVYGRRRVGKTFLIRHYYRNRIAFQLTALAHTSTTENQLLNFHLVLDELPGVAKAAAPPENWLYAFHRLKGYLANLKIDKKVIFIDELPWLDTDESHFIQALENFWNGWASARDDIILIVCGSAASWMINNLINNHGGLHNRITERIHLQPFNLKETEELLKLKNPAIDRYQIIQLYMVMGGIPFYLNNVKGNESAAQNIDRLCFSQTGLLRLEFNNLYLALFKNAEQHIKIVRALATKAKGLTRNELIKLTKLSNGGGTTKTLEELEQSGFIRKYTPFQKRKKSSVYQLVDFYTLFYLRFIEPSNPLDENTWINAIDHPQYRTWSGYAYEQICFYHIQAIKKALGIGGVQTSIYSWRSHKKENNVQIDLIIDRRDRVINICEIKFTLDTYSITKEYAAKLRNKLSVFRTETGTKSAVWLTFITTYGLQNFVYWGGLVQHDLTMDIFFE
ncbi:MAG: ATP-binding protein [Saprospiraceae bacterium]